LISGTGKNKETLPFVEETMKKVIEKERRI